MSRLSIRRGVRLRVRNFIALQKRRPCEICQIQYNHWQMQFDHINHKTKKKNVSMCKTLTEAKAEISKCRLLCANCHADVTYKNKYVYTVVENLSKDIQLEFLSGKPVGAP